MEETCFLAGLKAFRSHEIDTFFGGGGGMMLTSSRGGGMIQLLYCQCKSTFSTMFFVRYHSDLLVIEVLAGWGNRVEKRSLKVPNFTYW